MASGADRLGATGFQSCWNGDAAGGGTDGTARRHGGAPAAVSPRPGPAHTAAAAVTSPRARAPRKGSAGARVRWHAREAGGVAWPSGNLAGDDDDMLASCALGSSKSALLLPGTKVLRCRAWHPGSHRPWAAATASSMRHGLVKRRQSRQHSCAGARRCPGREGTKAVFVPSGGIEHEVCRGSGQLAAL